FAEPAPGEFAQNEAARSLLDPGLQIRLDLDSFVGRMAHSRGTRLSLVRTGAPAYAERFGLRFWEDLDAHPEVGASFDALMGIVGHGTTDPDILLDSDWSSVRHVADIGGGTGALLAEILRAHPEVRGTLVDLPRVATPASETFESAGVADRVMTIGQSFF